MDQNTALRRLNQGIAILEGRRAKVQRREQYVRGEQDLPFAPIGINAEYQDLLEQSVANYTGLAVSAPIQRLRVDSILTGYGKEADAAMWEGTWQANKLDLRQEHPYRQMMSQGRGIMSVWPNKSKRERPIVRPEDYELVHVEMDPDDPFTPFWAVKSFVVDEFSPATNNLVLPFGASGTLRKTVGIVYDDTTMWRFERGGLLGNGQWQVAASSEHPMKKVPFALYDYKPNHRGEPQSAIDGLMPQQDAINTIRFNTLLAMQFSAYRQRIVTGFDPRVLDKDGNVQYRTNPDGTPMFDANGNAVPLLNSPGRAGVDRLMAFPGGETKVFDLPESNLDNYIKVLESFLVIFFSTGQIPPQYLLSQMANLSGDALAGAESTLASLVSELKLAAGEGNETMYELAWYASGETREYKPTTEVLWADAEARSFAQIVDAVVKLVSVDFPKQAAFEMIPGATSTKVDRWMTMIEDEAFSNRLAMASRSFRDVTPGQPIPALPATGAGATDAPADGS